MTPMFIQEPFWNLTYQLPQAYYVTINPRDALLPKELAQKGLVIKEDIADVLRKTVERNIYQTIREKIDQADAVLIGASNGLSISEGFNLFADDMWFQENFGDFRAKYGIHSVLQGMFFCFPSQEEKWAFWSRLVYRKAIAVQPSRMMLDLYQLVADKNYYVITSNGEDHFLPVGFAPERVFEFEGKLTEICSWPLSNPKPPM